MTTWLESNLLQKWLKSNRDVGLSPACEDIIADDRK